MKNFKKMVKFSNLVIILVIIMNLWFTIKVLDAFIITATEPSVLIGSFFAFTTGELWMLASIKKTKVKREINNLSDNTVNTNNNTEKNGGDI